MASRELRRRKGAVGQAWHFCSNCKHWPVANFETAWSGDVPVCEECRGLERRQMCTRSEAFL